MKKIMKKVMSYVGMAIVAVTLLSGKAAVKADVVVEAWEINDFAANHRMQCDIEDRYYIVNGTDSEINLYKSPEDSEIIGTIKSKEEYNVSVIYSPIADKKWACIILDGEEGWTLLDNLTHRYDGISFREDYQDSFSDESGDFDLLENGFVLYEYPNSPNYNYLNYECEGVSYSKVYVDQDGRKWGHIDYYETASGWICVDDPEYRVAEADMNYANCKEIAEEKVPADAAPSGIINSKLIIIVAMVIGVTLLTAIALIIKLAKKKA